MIGMFLIKTAQDLIGSRDEVKSQKVLVLVDIPGDKRQRADFYMNCHLTSRPLTTMELFVKQELLQPSFKRHSFL